MARPEKVQQVETLGEVFKEARSIVLNDFTGLDVEKISELRRKCREAGVEYRVVKNTLAKLSVKGTPGEGLGAHFEGPTALAISRETENLSAKVLAEFAKEHEAPKFKAALVGGEVIDATAALALAKLPRNSSPVRVRNRCEVSGRPRGFYRKFKMSRIALRDLGSKGQIPGLVKSSW